MIESIIKFLTALAGLIKKILPIHKIEENRNKNIHEVDLVIDCIETWRKEEQHKLLRAQFNSDVHRVSFNTAVWMIKEALQLLDSAADNIKDYNIVADILLTQIKEQRSFMGELISYTNNQQKHFKHEREITERYQDILAKLEITIPVLEQRQRDWFFAYRKAKNK